MDPSSDTSYLLVVVLNLITPSCAVGLVPVVPVGKTMPVSELNIYCPVPDVPNVKSAFVTSWFIADPESVKLPVSAFRFATPIVPVYLAPFM